MVQRPHAAASALLDHFVQKGIPRPVPFTVCFLTPPPQGLCSRVQQLRCGLATDAKAGALPPAPPGYQRREAQSVYVGPAAPGYSDGASLKTAVSHTKPPRTNTSARSIAVHVDLRRRLEEMISMSKSRIAAMIRQLRPTRLVKPELSRNERCQDIDHARDGRGA